MTSDEIAAARRLASFCKNDGHWDVKTMADTIERLCDDLERCQRKLAEIRAVVKDFWVYDDQGPATDCVEADAYRCLKRKLDEVIGE